MTTTRVSPIDRAPTTPHYSRQDDGSVLIITFIFLIMVSLVVATLSSWAANGLNNSKAFKSAAHQLYAASGATQIAMRAARYTYPSTNPSVCPGTTTPMLLDGVFIQVWCQTKFNAGINATRETTLSACLMPDGTTQLTGACTIGALSVPTLLVAVVDYNDTTADYNPYNPNCTTTNQSTCGASMTVFSWESR